MVIKMNMILLMMTVMTVGSLRDDDDDDGSESFPRLTKLTCVGSNFIASIWTA